MATAAGALAVAAVLIGCAGCGGRYIGVELDRPASLDQPAWVGVYFLSQETALDDVDNVQLADPDGVPQGGGVVRKEVYPLFPGGDTRRIELKDYDPQIRWIVVAAGLPGSPACAREKIPVKEGAKLMVSVSVAEQCVLVDVH